MPAKATYLASMISELPHLGIHKKRPGIVLKTLQVIPALLHNQTRQPKATNPFAQHREPFTGHCHFALRVQFENIEPRDSTRWPPEDGVVGFDIQLLWTREQKMSQAETVFLESFQHMLSIREPVL